MKKQEQKMEYEKVPLLTVWREHDKIRFHSGRDIDNFALYGFLKTYIQFLEEELTENMAESNEFFKKDK